MCNLEVMVFAQLICKFMTSSLRSPSLFCQLPQFTSIVDSTRIAAKCPKGKSNRADRAKVLFALLNLCKFMTFLSQYSWLQRP